MKRQRLANNDVWDLVSFSAGGMAGIFSKEKSRIRP